MDLKKAYKQVADKDEAFEKIKQVITPAYLAQFKVQTDIQYDKKSYCMTGKGKGFTLNLSFQDDHLDVDLELAFLLKAFKPKILASIEEQVDKVI